MGDDAIAEPSLLWARHDIAHREHQHQHEHEHQHQRQHRHQHQKLHRRQVENGAAVVTEVIATVSVIQQIDVDSNGNTISMTVRPAPTDYSPALTDSAPPTSVPVVDNVESTTTSTPNPPGQPILSLPPNQIVTDAPAVPPAIPSSFSSFVPSSNSTSSTPSSSSQTFSNSTRTASRTSLTYFTSSSAKSDETNTRATSSPYFSGSSLLSASTGDGAFAPGGTAINSGATASSTGGSQNGSGSGSGPDTPTPVIIGSVVSSVAGAAVIILAVLFIWRWRKRTRNMVSLGSISGAAGESPDPIAGGPPPRPSGGMSERRSFVYAVPAALASLSGYKRFSQKTERTISSTAGSEKGFYRVSGRKLPSVLQSGGDGYGGGIDDMNTQTLSGSSFYQDSHGFYGGPGSPTVPPLQRDSGIPIMRPSPARTPVTEQGPFSSSPPPPLVPPNRPDLLGRSHPSQDGSHASRFTEEV